jgi:hypothetical protein
MAAELLVTAYRALDANGNPYAGAKWNFYIGSETGTGTTTRQAIYTNAAMDVEHTNPVVADAGGKFPNIFGDASLRYRGILTNATGSVVVHDINPINSTVLAELAESGGSANVGFIAAGTGSIARDMQAARRDILTLADKATTANALTGLQNVNTDNQSGVSLNIPKGTWVLPSKFTANGQRFNAEGEGRNVAIISYTPTLAGTALEFNHSATAGGMYQGSLNNVGFTSGNTVDKTAIALVNCADFELTGIAIPTGAWQGSGSIGVYIRGRQSVNFHTAEIACARPLVIGKNPVFTSLNTDHFMIGGGGVLELTTTLTTGKCIEFEPDVMITTCQLSNLALPGGKYGIYWSESGSAGASYGLVIEKLRREQADDATGYSVYLDAGSQVLQSLVIRDSYMDQNQNGIYLRKAQRVVLDNVIFAQGVGSGLIPVNMTFIAGSSLTLINCRSNTGVAMQLTNAVCVRRENVTNIGFVEEWVFKADSRSGAIVSDTMLGGVPFTLAVDEVKEISDNLCNMFIDIFTSEDVAATYHLAQTTLTVTEISDWAGFFTNTKDTPSRVNIYWDAGTSRYVIQNKRASSLTVSILRRGFAI